jgi:Cu/Ag efflux protein CusF
MNITRQLGALLAATAAAATLACSDAVATGRDYTVRGQVIQLPAPGLSGELLVRHEPIDDFVNRSGDTVGMDSMTMGFPVDRGVALDGVATGDVVEVVVHIDWDADRPVAINRLRKLPAGTKLDFRPARPPER